MKGSTLKAIWSE